MEKQHELIQQLFEKHAVTIHTEAFIDLEELGGEATGNAPPSTPPAPTSN